MLYFVFVGVFAWAGFGMGISSVSSQNWVEYEVGGEKYNEGLFQGAIKANDTKFTVERLSFIDATAGLYITSVILAFVTAILVVQGTHIVKRPVCIVALVCVCVSTTLDLVGVSVYQSNLDSGYSGSGAQFGSNSTMKIGYGLIAAWVVFCSHFLATCGLSILYMQLDEWQQ